MQTENSKLKKRTIKTMKVMKKIMAEKSIKTGQPIAKWCRIPGFRKFFLGMWDSLSHKKKEVAE